MTQVADKDRNSLARIKTLTSILAEPYWTGIAASVLL